jgi:hypothetical protein
VLSRLAAEAGLQQLELESMFCPIPMPAEAHGLSEAEAMVARLYFSFAYRKDIRTSI